ncbi:MAG: DUF1553 domain-containing protein [Verrucomicrobiae bacterium]|nr:DUF1553 domain-containing protein [Verrucomicrobiae bacterium]
MTPRTTARSGWLTWAITGAAVVSGTGIWGGETAGTGVAGMDVTERALTVLREHCVSCHDGERPKGGLVLSTAEGLARGGEDGMVVVAGRPEESLLVRVLAPDGEPHMPPKGQLSDEEISVLREWVTAGTPWGTAQADGASGGVRMEVAREAVEPLPSGYRPVQALALSEDGRRLAVGRGSAVRVYGSDGTHWVSKHHWVAHRDLVRSVAWSREGRRLATGGYRSVTVWDPESGTAEWSVTPGLRGRVNAVAFTPHGGALVVADGSPGEAGWVRLFGAGTGEELAAWKAHGDQVVALALSADGGLLATAGADGMVRIWEMASRQEVGVYEGHAGSVMGVAFNPMATEMVTVGLDRQMRVWDVATRESVVTFQGRPYGMTSVAWSRDGTRVVAGDAAGRLVGFTEFKRHTGAQSSATGSERGLGTFGAPLHAVAVSADGRWVFAGGEDGAVVGLSAEGEVRVRWAPEEDGEPVGAGEEGGEGEGPSWVRDVLPMLTKAGCSAGSCHAKPEGQNGFHLSVFSHDPRADHAEVVMEGRGRRVFPGAPDASLVMLKATGAVQHGGGRRFGADSEEAALLRAWIRGGMIYRRAGEADLEALEIGLGGGTIRSGVERVVRVTARYADGTEREVTHLAEFDTSDRELMTVDGRGILRVVGSGGEGVVVARFGGKVGVARVTVPAEVEVAEERYAGLPEYNFIDTLAHRHFRRLGLLPSELATDAEFLRRATLDTLGVLPTPDEARAFLGAPGLAGRDGDGEGVGDEDEEASRMRRAAWVERLLGRPEWADYWANRWADLLRPNPDRVGVKSVYLLDQWLREAFRENLSYDRFVREILEAEGTNHRDGPVVVYRDRREPVELATMFGQLFLGVRMECARCHHHPSEKWSQEDFYQFAAVFGGLQRKGAGLSPPISAGTETFASGGRGKVTHPVTGAVMSPRAPDGPDWGGDDAADARRALTDWLTGVDNPFFARAAVNRVWAAFFGRGWVEPVDDFRVSNPAGNEVLLDALAEDFARHGYDWKHLMRTILNSRLYQLSATPNGTNVGDTRHFSRSYRRRLPAEVLLDAVSDVTGVGESFPGCPPGTRAMETWSYKVSSRFLDTFGRPNSSSDCPCERDTRPSVAQALHLMHSPRVQEKLAGAEGRVHRLASGDLGPEAIVTELYLAAYSRYPTAEERRLAAAAFEAEGATRQTATEDVLWALLNSAEFVFNH